MDEIERVLQCFEDCYRNCVREKYEDYYPVREYMEYHLIDLAFGINCPKTLHALIDIGIGRTTRRTPRSIIIHPNTNPTLSLILIDRGIKIDVGNQRFVQSRERARNAAIAVLGCFSHGRSAAVGEKDVGIIIGRAIWESRGIKEWMN
jgi:hypothetical protein